MGWHRIDPKTGEPAKNAHSRLSRPDAILLNAVPGVDDHDDACYLGDGPWDMASGVPAEIVAVVGDKIQLTDEQLRELLLRRVVPAEVTRAQPTSAKLLKVVDLFWHDIDSCYEEDWNRPARDAEKRWVCENVIMARRSHES